MITVDAVFAALDSQLSTEFVLAINIVDKMDILETDNAIARKDTSGFLEPADLVALMKPSTVLYVNALLDLPVMSMDYALNLTLSLTAIIMKDTILCLKLAFVFKELLSLEENAKPSQAAQAMLTMMVFNASVNLDSFSVDHNVSVFKSSFQPAQIMPISMEFPALAMLDSSKAASQPALLARMELNGMESIVLLHQVKMTVQVDINIIMFQIIASH
jgi:hypothetical protein